MEKWKYFDGSSGPKWTVGLMKKRKILSQLENDLSIVLFMTNLKS
jgi:hypothetical protein